MFLIVIAGLMIVGGLLQIWNLGGFAKDWWE